MARAVYSTQFLALGPGTSGSASYTVPAGFVAVVRDTIVLLDGATTDNALVTLGASGPYIAYFKAATAAATLYTATGRTVVPAGGVIHGAFVAATLGSLLCSGYLLTV